MKTIPFNKAYELLADCAAIIWGIAWSDNFVGNPVFTDDKIFLSHKDDDRQIYEVYFRREDNPNVICVGSSIWLQGSDGNEYQITILVPIDLNSIL